MKISKKDKKTLILCENNSTCKKLKVKVTIGAVISPATLSPRAKISSCNFVPSGNFDTYTNF